MLSGKTQMVLMASVSALSSQEEYLGVVLVDRGTQRFGSRRQGGRYETGGCCRGIQPLGAPAFVYRRRGSTANTPWSCRSLSSM